MMIRFHIKRLGSKEFLTNSAGAIIGLSLFLRNYLTSDGYIIYRDFGWPYYSKLLLSSWTFFDPGLINVSLGQSDPVGFFRAYLTWPFVLLATLGIPSETIQKVFFGTTFLLVYVLLYFSTKTIDRVVRNRPPDIVRVLLILAGASNFYVMQVVTWYPLWVGFALLVLLSTRLIAWLWFGSTRDLMVCVLCWLGALMLDYRFAFWVTVLLTLIILITNVVRRNLQFRFKRSVQAIVFYIATTVSLLSTFFLLNTTSNNVFGNPTTLINSAETYIGRAPSIVDAVRLLGYWWSTVAYQSPTPSLSTFWFATTFILPFLMALTAVMSRKLGIEYVVVSLVGIDISAGTNSPVNSFLMSASVQPLSQIFKLALTPSYYNLVLAAVGYVICMYLLVLHISTRKLRPIMGLIRKLLIFMVLLLILFSSWQFYNGSLYPSGSLAIGSAISKPIGVLDPSSPPLPIYDAYNWLMNQSGMFNTVWIPGPFGMAYTWNQKSSPFNEYYYPPKPFVYSHLFEVNSALLNRYHVKYVVVQNYTETAALKIFYHFNNLTELRNFLTSQGLILVWSEANMVWIYFNPSAPNYTTCESPTDSYSPNSTVVARPLTSFYWQLRVSSGSNCALSLTIMPDAGWILVGADWQVSHPVIENVSLLTFRVKDGNYVLIYVPFFTAATSLATTILTIVGAILVMLREERSHLFWLVVALAQLLSFAMLFFVSMLIHEMVMVYLSLLVLFVSSTVLILVNSIFSTRRNGSGSISMTGP